MPSIEQHNDQFLIEGHMPPDLVSIISLCSRSIVVEIGEAARFGVATADDVGVCGS